MKISNKKIIFKCSYFCLNSKDRVCYKCIMYNAMIRIPHTLKFINDRIIIERDKWTRQDFLLEKIPELCYSYWPNPTLKIDVVNR